MIMSTHVTHLDRETSARNVESCITIQRNYGYMISINPLSLVPFKNISWPVKIMTLKSSFITGIPIGNTLWMKQISLSAKKENGKKKQWWRPFKSCEFACNSESYCRAPVSDGIALGVIMWPDKQKTSHVSSEKYIQQKQKGHHKYD